MSIRIIEEEEILLTQEEHERLQREWQESQRYTTAPCSFEVWLRGHGYGRRGSIANAVL